MNEPVSRTEERQRSPEAFLELAEKETRGKLKVFLGMAPGVGKTYAMLAAAHAQKEEGVDVVVGVVETHGRSETAALLDDLEVLPRRPIVYRHRTIMEFDVEAAAARRPALLLVDELAHTNAPGSLQLKRYQDVERLLAAGINVWTTLNIQHLESLSDVVHHITGIVIRETVPDTVIEKANHVVVIDLPPEELIQRLKEGKVYLPETARRAVDQYFKLSNLTALRELALRRAADRVDEQMLSQLRQQGIEGPWPTSERLLVCIGGDEQSEALVRAACRMATAAKADWLAVHVKLAQEEAADVARLRRVEKAIRLAERLGATTARVIANDLVGEILGYAKRNNITQVILGRSTSGVVSRFRGRALSSELVARASGIAVTVMADKSVPSARTSIDWPKLDETSAGALVALVAVGLAILVATGLERLTALPNISMVFLFAVLLAAFRFGLWPAVGTALLSFVAYNFFFIHPRHTLTVTHPHELFSLFIFLVVAIVTGGLAGRLREQADATRNRAEATQSLYDFSRKLSGAASLDDVLWVFANHVAMTVKGQAIVLLHDGKNLDLALSWRPDSGLANSDWAAARWAYQKREPAGRGTGTLPNARLQFRPIVGAQRTIGVVGIDAADGDEFLPASTESALQSIIEQATLAIDRTRLVEEATRAEGRAERERLHAALLSSVSHDLRTPLASMLGSVTSLRTFGDRLSPEDRADMLAAIEEETRRLTRFVSNLLDMTKLEAGFAELHRDWVELNDVVRGAATRAERAYPGRRIDLDIAPDVPLVRGDATLLEQIVFNILDNAFKFSGPSTVPTVAVRPASDAVVISVTDDGIGIPGESLERVFDKFFRVSGGDGRPPGTGLGLSICSGLIKAMGGTIVAESPVTDGRGTRITLRLPVPSDEAAEALPVTE